MDKAVVVYSSKYGSTKKYAEWIADELSCDLFERKVATTETLLKYDTIIFGGGLYAGGVSGIELITKSFEKIASKKLVVFTCGLADPTDDENIANIKRGLYKKLNNKMQNKIKVFHLRGGVDYSRLSFIHRSMMAMLYKMVSKKDYEKLSEEEKEMLETYGKKVDFSDKNTIQPIVSYVRGE